MTTRNTHDTGPAQEDHVTAVTTGRAGPPPGWASAWEGRPAAAARPAEPK